MKTHRLTRQTLMDSIFHIGGDPVVKSDPKALTAVAIEGMTIVVPADPHGILNVPMRPSHTKTRLEHMLHAVLMERAGFGWLSGVGGFVEDEGAAVRLAEERLGAIVLQSRRASRYSELLEKIVDQSSAEPPAKEEFLHLCEEFKPDAAALLPRFTTIPKHLHPSYKVQKGDNPPPDVEQWAVCTECGSDLLFWPSALPIPPDAVEKKVGYPVPLIEEVPGT